MAIYHFQNKVVSRGKGQSAIAKSAYNSASKIKDYEENDYKDYSNKQCDYSEILLPKNADDNFKNREYLWNKIHNTENRKNSRLAREIIIGLPNEFNPNENIELAKEFSETLSNEGMIVDLNIHKINDENPHAHLLCTVRGFDENGNFEPKRIGNKRVRDWDTDDKHNEWRKRWETIQNKHLEMKGFSVRVSADSYKNQNIDLEPTKKEGWKARKFEDETGKKSSISKYNESIKKRNQQKINKMFDEVDDLKSHKLNAFSYMDKSDSSTLKDMAKDLKIYVTPINIYEENERLYDLKQKTALITNDEDRLKKIENIEDRQKKLESINEVFKKQAGIFFDKNYPEQVLNYSDNEKIFITRTILNEREELPFDHELEGLVKAKRFKEAQISLNSILGNRDISIESIEKESSFFADKLSNILNKNNLSFDDVLENKHEGLEDSLKINYYTNKLDVLRNAENTLEDYYDVQIRELFTDDQDYKAFNEVADIKEKQQLIDFKTYHGSDNTLKMLETGNFIPKYSDEDRKYITEQIKLLQEIEFKPNKNQNDKFVFGAIQKKLLNEYDYDYSDSNDLKHLYQESNEVGDKASIENIEEFYEGSEILVDKETYNNNRKQHAYSLVNAGLDSMIFNFNEIFRERMPKYINKQYKGKNHSKKRHEVSNKRGIHL
ncbi:MULTISPECIES: MobA/MobL family protein [Staphylococcus]|uniref:MobA/MobL family protein n=1 Tax=Staphylococcus TaxID=1279 RepID=UPI0028FEF17B|nr:MULTISPECIES: MobA/MobL family protein [Staphylococcus]MDU0435915.1 MobA/MobL family protein [Staphylococcus haemolyticus]MDU0463552.1 MobA/MobL family protein [Staphylococcus ureilyticus]